MLYYKMSKKRGHDEEEAYKMSKRRGDEDGEDEDEDEDKAYKEHKKLVERVFQYLYNTDTFSVENDNFDNFLTENMIKVYRYIIDELTIKRQNDGKVPLNEQQLKNYFSADYNEDILIEIKIYINKFIDYVINKANNSSIEYFIIDTNQTPYEFITEESINNILSVHDKQTQQYDEQMQQSDEQMQQSGGRKTRKSNKTKKSSKSRKSSKSSKSSKSRKSRKSRK